MAPRAKTSFCGSRLVRSTLALVFIAALGVGYALLGRSASPAATAAATAFRLDHFQCYRVKPPGAFTPRRVTLVDQFGKSKAVASQVTTLCAPVSKNKSVVRNRLAHLACYPITRKPRFRPRRATITNQFEKATPVVVVKPVQLCLPSGKTLASRPRPAAGEGARPLPVLPGQAAAEAAAAPGRPRRPVRQVAPDRCAPRQPLRPGSQEHHTGEKQAGPPRLLPALPTPIPCTPGRDREPVREDPARGGRAPDAVPPVR